MKSSRIVIACATLAMGTMLAWAASPAVTAPKTGVSAYQGQMQQMSPEDRAKAATDRLDKAVTLTDDQKTKIMAIYTQGYKDMADARANGGDTRAVMTKMNADVKAVLTPDQQAKMPQGRGRRGGGGGGGSR